MNTTEVFVEQVLIGGLVLTVAAFLFPEFTSFVFSTDAGWGALVVSGGLLIACAYLVGIVADRVADTMLGEWERWNRLHYALDSRRPSDGVSDPFPEGKYRTLVMAGGGLNTYADYLRTRIRLSRAIAVLAPAIASAAIIGNVLEGEGRRAWALTMLGAYALVFLVRVGVLKPSSKGWRRAQKRPSGIVWIFLSGVPRTDAVPEAHDPYRGDEKVGLDVVLLGGLLVFSVLQWVAVGGVRDDLWWRSIGVAGALISLLSGWAWARISKTYYTHVDDSYRHVISRRNESART